MHVLSLCFWTIAKCSNVGDVIVAQELQPSVVLVNDSTVNIFHEKVDLLN
jgi:hypothetical protein